MPAFSSAYSPLFLVLFLAAAAAASWFFYRRSPLSNTKKYLLISLKTAAIFILLALFIEPVLSYLTGKSENRGNIVLVDLSRSSSLENKPEYINRVLKETGNNNSNAENIFGFSAATNKISNTDSLNFNVFNTDLSLSLRQIKENYPDGSFSSITIITDGIFNSGGNPIYESGKLNAPFIIIPTGDTAEKKDIIIKGTAHSEKAFTGTSVKIRVYIDAFKTDAGAVGLKLLREGIEIKSQQVNINTAEKNYTAEFDVTETEPGKIKYTVSAEQLQGELTYKNNVNSFYITYIDNKVNLLVISGGPGYDNEFTGSVLKSIGNYNITYRTAKSPGEFYEGPIDNRQFAELSAVFLLNYPTSSSSVQTVNDIAANVKQFNVPVIFFAGKNTDYGKLASFDEMLPFTAGRPNSGENLLRLSPVGGIEGGLDKIAGLGSTNEIFRNVSGIMPKPGSITLATDKSTGEPVIMNRVNGLNRSSAFLGYGLWRWKLNSGANASKTLEALLLEMINMTLQKEKRTRLKLYPEKDIFDYTESIKIYAEVYDDNFALTRNAKVQGRIKNKDGSKSIELNFKPEENRFSAVTGPLSSGDYYIECDAEYNGSYLARENNRFSSDTLNNEYLETRTNMDALRELAAKTKGAVIFADSLNRYQGYIKEFSERLTGKTDQERYLRFDLWGNKYYLLLVILLFSAEWVLRKRNNIP